MTSTFTQQVDPDNSRLDANLGGHPLLDVGIYCVNAARYLFRAEPTEVTAFVATGSDPKFKEVPEMVSCRPARSRASGWRRSSAGSARPRSSRVPGARDQGRHPPRPGVQPHGRAGDDGDRGWQVEGNEVPDSDQIAPEIVYFSDCIREGRRPEPDGREGLIDLWIIEAIKSSATERNGGAAAAGSGEAAAGQGATDDQATEEGRARAGKCRTAGRVICSPSPLRGGG